MYVMICMSNKIREKSKCHFVGVCIGNYVYVLG